MPKRRPPRAVWNVLREIVWRRDGKRCVRCVHEGIAQKLPLSAVHIDHIVSGKRGSNAVANLRTLCRYHHVLRVDKRHRGLIAHALREGIIPPNWRELVWGDP